MSVEIRDLENEVEELEKKLNAAKARLRAAQPNSPSSLGNLPNIGIGNGKKYPESPSRIHTNEGF
jgi:hypothetical protein